jgi:beta-mannosidase
MKKLYIFIAVMLSSVLAWSAVWERELNHGWKFRQARLTNWYPAAVPGVVHLDLLSNGIIDDPYYRLNERSQQWIDKEDWMYQTEFSLSKEELTAANARLHFYGLDCYADVYLNGEKILTADNMFREWKADVGGILKADSNILHVYFHSPIKVDIPKFDALPYQYRVGPDQSENGGIFDKRISIFARKAGYQYGWDWGPRFVTSGIWRMVTIEFWNDAKIEDVYIEQKKVTSKQADITAHVEFIADKPQEHAKIIVKDKSGMVYAAKTIAVKQGTNVEALDFSIKDPKLWWSNGLGAANLYTFEVELAQNGAAMDKRSVTTGLRSLRVVMQPDKDGEALYVELNGVKVFAKGANYVPQDNFIPRVTMRQYEQTIADAASANMNMLRVWGGGTYESDYFYELCDKHGIMVWQDFMFACSLYPSEGKFLENIRQEAIDNVKRLRSHACIALWCGNNETYYFWTLWNYDEYYRSQNPEYEKIIWKQYCDLFDVTLPDVVKKYSTGTFYLPSSPYNRNKDEEHNGDRHYWGVWHGNEPTMAFNNVRSRFFSEYGFQSFPEYESVKLFAPMHQDWDIASEVMMAHQRAGSYANARIADYLQREYRLPWRFEDFLYMSQVLQGDAVKTAIEAHRRSMPYCMGTLFWQHNDCWPVASWSSRDYYGRWKAQHYFAKKAYRDILLSPIVIGDSMLAIAVVSDRTIPADGILKLTLINLHGDKINELSKPIKVPANTSSIQWQQNTAAFLKHAAKNEVVLLASFTDKSGAAYDNRYFFDLHKNIDFPQPNIRRMVKPSADGVEVMLESGKYARAVYLSIEGVDNFFSDNYFDMLPHQHVVVSLRTTLTAAEVDRQLKIRSLADAYGERQK